MFDPVMETPTRQLDIRERVADEPEHALTLAPRTVVITGAGGNLGKAVAQTFLKQDARVVLIGRRLDVLQGNFDQGNTRLMLASADLLDGAATSGLMDAIIERYGQIDVLCNLAGGFTMGESVHQASMTSWRSMFELNVQTLLNVSQAVVPGMIDQGNGKIVNVGAFAAQRGAALMGPYAASKSMVMRITESMSAELRDSNINVNCVLPTIIDTPENRAAMPDADPRRWVSPFDLAAVIRFLASDAARAIHGVALPVSGLS